MHNDKERNIPLLLLYFYKIILSLRKCQILCVCVNRTLTSLVEGGGRHWILNPVPDGGS